MLNPNFVIVGAVISLIGGLSYLIDTVKGKVKPNRVTWFLWILAPAIAFFAELSKGVGITSLMTFVVGFIPLLIFIASFVNKKSQWKLGMLDGICGAFSILGLVLWYLTKEGNIAILFSILADGFAAAPTVVKSFQFPDTESKWAYLFFSINGLITLLTISTWNFANYGFPAYIFLVNLIIFILVRFKLGKIISQGF